MDSALVGVSPLQFALCDVSPTPGVGRAYLYHLLAEKDGEVEVPTEILLWRDGVTKTTKGNFLLDDKARDLVWADWQERMNGVPSPSGDPPGSFDYDHDEWNPNLPGYMKLSAGSFDLAREGKDLWLVKVVFTELAEGMIRRKEKRSTSPAFDFEPKTGRFLRLYNVAVTNVPATHKQALLASLGTQGQLLTPPGMEPAPTPPPTPAPTPAAPPEPSRTLVQVPARLATITGPVPFTEYPLDESDSYDAEAAVGRLKDWATKDGKINLEEYARAFAYVAGEGEDFADYKLPHHDVKDGALVTVWGGVKAAGDAIQAGSAGVPDADLPTVKAHLEQHYHEFDRTAPWESTTDTTASASATTAAPPPVAAPTGSLSMSTWYINCSAEDLLMFTMGSAADQLFLASALAQKCAAGSEEQKAFTSQVASNAKYMAELSAYAGKLGMKGLSEQEMTSELDEDEMASLSAEAKAAFLGCAKYGLQRGVKTLSAAMIALGIDKTSALRPAILDLKTALDEKTKAAAQTQTSVTSNTAAARRVLLTSMQERNLVSPAFAQEAEGLDPATGKPRVVMLSGKPHQVQPMTLSELQDCERRALERLAVAKASGATSTTAAAQLSGAGTGSPPAPPAGSAATPPALPAAGDPGTVISEDDIAMVIAGMDAMGEPCTRDQAIAQLKANKAGKYGVEAVAAIKASAPTT